MLFYPGTIGLLRTSYHVPELKERQAKKKKRRKDNQTFQHAQRVLITAYCRAKELVGRTGTVLSNERQVRVLLDGHGGERLLNRNELVLLAEPAVPLLHAVPATASLSQCQPTSSCFASETSSLAPCLFQNLNSALDSIRFTPALFQYESSASEASTRPKGPHEDSVEGLEMQLERDRLDIFTELACGGLIPTYLPDRSAGFKSQAPEDDEHLNASTGPRAEIHHLSSLRHPSKARCQKFPMRHRMEA